MNLCHKKDTRMGAVAVAVAMLFSTAALAQYGPPAGYYAAAEGKSGTQLQTALNGIIKNHTKLSYTACWTALREIDQDPANSNNILCIYSRRSIPKTAQDGSSSASIVWNREHS